MKTYLINKNSDKLLIFFTGWGCDEYEFEHLETNSDVLLLYDYTDLNLEFDFSKYKSFDLIAFSAGVFVASVIDFDFEINNRIAISGNPLLFDEKFGLSTEIQNILCNITNETADNFARNYLVKTDEEWKIFHHSKRTVESCRAEFESLKRIYKLYQQKINYVYDNALFGEEDRLFNVQAQKEYFGKKLHIIKNARHNIFFRIKHYDQLFELVCD